MKLKTLKSFEITSFCPTVCWLFFPRLNKMNADHTLSYALMGSLINLDRYQCFCVHFGYVSAMIFELFDRSFAEMFSSNKTTIYAWDRLTRIT